MKEFSNSFYPKVIFIERVVKYGKIPTEILLYVIFQPNILRTVGFYVRHSAIGLPQLKYICRFIWLSVFHSNIYIRSSWLLNTFWWCSGRPSMRMSVEIMISSIKDFPILLYGAKYLGFFSSRSLKTRGKHISFAQFVYLFTFQFLNDKIHNYVKKNT